jgi:putative membrane protein
MAFIDDLVLELFSIAFVGLLTLYMVVGAYFGYRKKGTKDLYDHIRPGIIPLAVLGVLILILGLYGEMTWPLPGSYNILFYDPYVMLGVVLIGFTISVELKQKLHYVGLLSMAAGLSLLAYSTFGYSIGLTQSPLALFGLYLAFGSAGILAFPVTLMIDSLVATKARITVPWKVVMILFWLALLTATVLAALLGVAALQAHLITPP